VNNVKKKLPKSLKEVLELEANAIKQLREYFEGQKGHIDYLFDKLQSDLKIMLKVEKEKITQQLEEQVKSLERNFTYYNLKLMKYDTVEPPQVVSVEEARKEIWNVLDKVKNGLKFREWVKDTNEDIEDLVIYNKFKSDENKMKGVARCLKFLSQQLQSQMKIRPVLPFNDNSLTKMKESLEAVFASSMVFDNPIRDLNISSFFFDSDIISSPKDFEYIRSLIDEDGTANIVQRVFINRPEIQISKILSVLDKYSKTLIVLRTHYGTTLGAYTDKSWARKPNSLYAYNTYSKNHGYSDQNQYVNEWKSSTKSFLIDLDEKQILRVRPEMTTEAIFCSANIDRSIQFGKNPDLILENNGAHSLKVSVNPGGTYYPSESKDNEDSKNILARFAGGKDKRSQAVVDYLEAFVILNPERDIVPALWKDL